MRIRWLLGAAVLLLLFAAPPRVAGEFQLNTIQDASSPSVDVDANGNFIVVFNQNGETLLRRFTSTGSPIGTEVMVDSYEAGDVAVAAEANGDFVIVWFTIEGSYFPLTLVDVFGHRFTSSGAPVGTEFAVNTYTTGGQGYSNVASDADGDFVVVWQSADQDGSLNGVFGQRYDSSGAPAGTEFRVNTYTTADQRFPQVAADPNGNFVVVWQSAGQDGSLEGVFGQRYDSGGAPVGTEFQVNTYTTDNQEHADVAADGDGDFVIVWSGAGSSDDYSIFGQRFDSAGIATGTEFQVNSISTAYHVYPTVSANDDGNFVVVWQGGPTAPDPFPFSTMILGQRYDSTGTAAGTEFQTNTTTGFLVGVARVTVSDGGNFLVTWTRETIGPGIPHPFFFDAMAQLYTGDGDEVPTPTPTVTPTPTATALAACGTTPDGGCTTGFAVGFLRVKEQDSLTAKMLKGPEILQADYGNPLVDDGTAYRLCIYDDTPSLVADLFVDRAGDSTCSGGSASCWKSLGAAPPDPGGKGYKYKDYDFASSGVAQIVLKGGAGSTGKSKIIVKAGGPALPAPIAADLTTTSSVTLQLRANDAPSPRCFSVTLSDIKKQEAGFFKAK